jgi:predicted phosphodiesterase
MRIAVISDIHSNLESLNRVLDDIKSRGIEKILCAGDMIGYGPNPREVIERVMQEGIECVEGNHEELFNDPRKLSFYGEDISKPIELAKAELNEEQTRFIQRLPRHIIHEGIRVVHGMPPSDNSDYVTECYQLGNYFMKRAMDGIEQKIAFVGHTHQLGVYRLDSETRKIEFNDKIILEKEKRYIVNAGNVGQRRENDISSSYVIFDGDSVEPVRVKYDSRITADEIVRKHLPAINGVRLLDRFNLSS